MQTYTRKGKAINLYIKAENEEKARRILSAPLVEVAALLSGVWFEKK